jgi:hypothetical protein
MKRIHLFEFLDLPWYPQSFRRIQTDYLQFVTTLGSGHKNLIPLITKAIRHCGTTEIIDLCSGGGGPWVGLLNQFKLAGLTVQVKLSDKFPNPLAIQKWSMLAREGIEYFCEPVDAMQVPHHLKGMRTMFEGFHHFRPEQASAILKDAFEKNAAIGIFEADLKPLFKPILLLLSPFTTIFAYLVLTPCIKPRRFSRFLWTYLIPLVPLATCWDGVISMLRGYSVEELQKLIQPYQRPSYIWETGLATTETPVFNFVYLLGYPAKTE